MVITHRQNTESAQAKAGCSRNYNIPGNKAESKLSQLTLAAHCMFIFQAGLQTNTRYSFSDAITFCSAE